MDIKKILDLRLFAFRKEIKKMSKEQLKTIEHEIARKIKSSCDMKKIYSDNENGCIEMWYEIEDELTVLYEKEWIVESYSRKSVN